MSSQRLSQLVRIYLFPYPVGNIPAADGTYHSLLSSKPRKAANPHQVASHAQNREFTPKRACGFQIAAAAANGGSAGGSGHSEEESAGPHHLPLCQNGTHHRDEAVAARRPPAPTRKRGSHAADPARADGNAAEWEGGGRKG